MNRPLGVGIVGAGPVTQAIHLPTLARLPDLFTVKNVMDVDPTVAAAVAARAGATPSTSSAEVMADPEVEVVAICSPPQFHAAQVREAVEAGKRAILCEKPFAVSKEEADAIASVSRASGTPIVVGAMHTFDPAWNAVLQAWNDRGAEAHTVRSSIVLPFNDRFEDWATQIHERRSGPQGDWTDLDFRAGLLSNAVLGLAVHNLPLVRRFVPRIDEVLSAAVLPPFGYSITLSGAGRTLELVGRMDLGWAPDWTFEAVGADASIRVEFPPSYVQAGSAVAALRTTDATREYGPFDANGYEVEWRHLYELANGTASPVQPLESVIDDLVLTVDIAERAVARYRQTEGHANG